MKKKLKIFLCDFVHNYLGVGSYMFPLNIGYIASWTHKQFPNKCDITLFKYPDDFLNHCKKELPDLVGFANYTWNADLNNRVSQWIKQQSLQTIVVYGGPNIDYSETGSKRFFKTNKGADFYVPYQGELPFEQLIKRIFSVGLQLKKIKSKPIDGVIFYDQNKDQAVWGKPIPRIENPDIIPSPYLTGLLDPFFNTNLIPIAETNRGCPYSCTYCCQCLSSHNQIEFFSLDRVQQELRYIAEQVKNTDILLFADSNFGIKERDVDIAKYLAQLTDQTGYPHKVSMNWAKNQPKLYDIGEILNNINLVISLQTLDKTVLKNIKRHNIKISVFKDILEKINKKGGMSGTELILGLPGETKESHMQSIRELFDWNVSYIICYNCLILEGSELSLMRENGKFECETKFRLIDNSYGKYNGIMSFEAEEGIRSTDTLTEEEILFFRPVHWLIQFLWNYRFYYDLLKYLQQLGINPLDYIVKLINESQTKASSKVKDLFQQFEKEAKDEWYDTPEKLCSHYSLPENFQWLTEGNYGKMNSKYIFKTILELKEQFEEYLLDIAVEMVPEKKHIFKEIIDYLSTAIIDFSQDEDAYLSEKSLTSQYDILQWKNNQYATGLEALCNTEGYHYEFSLTSDQIKSLKTLLKQYAHKNKNVTLRKMSEFMDIRDFFRNINAVQVLTK